MKTRILIASLVATTLLATSAFAVVRNNGTSADAKPVAASFDSGQVVHSKLGLSRPL